MEKHPELLAMEAALVALSGLTLEGKARVLDWLLKLYTEEAKQEQERLLKEIKEKCPPHDWNRDGERCMKCGTKDWMT